MLDWNRRQLNYFVFMIVVLVYLVFCVVANVLYPSFFGDNEIVVR